MDYAYDSPTRKAEHPAMQHQDQQGVVGDQEPLQETVWRFPELRLGAGNQKWVAPPSYPDERNKQKVDCKNQKRLHQ